MTRVNYNESAYHKTAVALSDRIRTENYRDADLANSIPGGIAVGLKQNIRCGIQKLYPEWFGACLEKRSEDIRAGFMYCHLSRLQAYDRS